MITDGIYLHMNACMLNYGPITDDIFPPRSYVARSCLDLLPFIDNDKALVVFIMVSLIKQMDRQILGMQIISKSVLHIIKRRRLNN